MEANIKRALADYIRTIADWRRSRFNDDLRDRRNLQSAEGLFDLATYVESLPDDDARLAELSRLCLRGERFEPGQQVHYELGRFRFFTAEATLEGFLDLLVDLARADSTEHGRFGGPQIAEDNPWE